LAEQSAASCKQLRMFREKKSIPENTGIEIEKTGIIPVSVLTIQYRIGNTIWEEIENEVRT
jgi:hypothetical protein